MDANAVKSWLEGLGLQARVQTGPTGDEVAFGSHAGAQDLGVIRWRTPTVMDAYVARRVSPAELATHWRDPSNASLPIEQLRAAVRHVAGAFPLVVGDVSEDSGGAIVYFSAVLFDEQLPRQAFALTVSSVLKAVDAFDAGTKARAEQLAALASLQAR